MNITFNLYNSNLKNKIKSLKRKYKKHTIVQLPMHAHPQTKTLFHAVFMTTLSFQCGHFLYKLPTPHCLKKKKKGKGGWGGFFIILVVPPVFSNVIAVPCFPQMMIYFVSFLQKLKNVANRGL